MSVAVLPQLWMPPKQKIVWPSFNFIRNLMSPLGLMGPNNPGVPTVIQQLESQSSSTSTLTFTDVSTHTGNILQLAISVVNGSSVSSVGDTVNTYARAFPAQGDGASIDLEIFTTTNAVPTGLSSGTVTVNITGGAAPVSAFMWEISGVNNTIPIDQSHSAFSVGGPPNSGATATLAAANELCFGAFGIQQGETPTISAISFTQGAPSTVWPTPSTNGYGGGQLVAGVLQITSKTGQAFSATFGTSGNEACACWALTSL